MLHFSSKWCIYAKISHDISMSTVYCVVLTFIIRHLLFVEMYVTSIITIFPYILHYFHRYCKNSIDIAPTRISGCGHKYGHDNSVNKIKRWCYVNKLAIGVCYLFSTVHHMSVRLPLPHVHDSLISIDDSVWSIQCSALLILFIQIFQICISLLCWPLYSAAGKC